jgi:sialidase-1
VRTGIPIALLLSLAVSGFAAEPVRLDLFEAGKGGYELYRIPGLVVTQKGTLFAYCEARKSSRGDWGPTDILACRSTDGGKTWSEPKLVAAVEGTHRKNPAALAKRLALASTGATYNNPVAIPDSKTGAVHFLFCLEYMRCFYCRSDDDGQTFSKPVEIIPTFDGFRKDYDWKVQATGPGHGIRLKSGRLLVPVWLSTGSGGGAHRPSVVSTIFSDDGGTTWQRGAIVANETTPLRNPNETVAVQLADGRVMLNIRNESERHRRGIALSPDGSTNWTEPGFDDALVEPICMASICRLTEAPPADRNRIIYANPHKLDLVPDALTSRQFDRKNLSLKLSYDEGKTWAVFKTLDPGPSGYSDLAVTPGGAIHCLYERGMVDGKNMYATKALTLARFDLDWLTDGKDRFPAQPTRPK